jgi:exodeoxyribonuclease VII large subunit
VYVPRGNYQLQVHKLEKEGMGSLYQRYLELKMKLEREGLFDASRKKPIPRYPKVIGVVTSPTGAVIRDIINTLERRFPASKVLLAPSKVQGEDAVPQLMAITLADFVADRRAPTPTAAAEMASPDQLELLQMLDETADALANGLRGQLLDYQNYVAELQQQLGMGLRQQIRLRKQELGALAERLSALDYRSVLQRGFSITSVAGERVQSVKQVKSGQAIRTFVADGSFEAEVK